MMTNIEVENTQTPVTTYLQISYGTAVLIESCVYVVPWRQRHVISYDQQSNIVLSSRRTVTGFRSSRRKADAPIYFAKRHIESSRLQVPNNL